MSDAGHSHSHNDHDHTRHDHTHGTIDPTLLTTERGIWAVKWSLIGLAATAAVQLIIVFISGSVALLADTIHNTADAGTAIPLWIAFALVRRKPSRRFTYGYGRVEDVAGVTIVLTILFSTVLAGYESINRLLHPQPVDTLAVRLAVPLIGPAKVFHLLALRPAGRTKQKRPAVARLTGLFNLNPAASYSSIRRPYSTIGAGGLNGRVRDGIGCDTSAIATGNL